MADKTIGELTAVTDVIGTDEYAVFRAGVTQKITADDLLAGTGGGGSGGGAELDYVERTTTLTVTATTAAGANDFIVGNTITLDGSTRIRIEFFAPISEASQFVQTCLWDGSTDLGIITDTSHGATGSLDVPVSAVRYLTPSAGTHTFKIKAFRGTGSAAVYAGPGGVPGGYVPAFLRISEAEPASSAVGGGWTVAGETWTYASADSPTFTFTVTGDLTGKYSAGMRVKLTQTTPKYFIVTKVAYSTGTTTVTVYGGTDYTLANATIASPYYSTAKAPAGFPPDPAKWSVEATDTSDRTQASPTAGVWYNPGSITISVPIGCWRLFYEANFDVQDVGAGGSTVYGTLSTANNSEVDKAMTAVLATASDRTIGMGSREKFVNLAAKQSYYLNVKAGASGVDSIDIRGDLATTIIRAVCAYL